MQARPEKGLDSPWVHVDGQVSADLDGRDTVDKVFTYVVQKYGGKTALGTRELLDATEHVQPNGRVFEKVTICCREQVKTILRGENIVVE